MKQRKLWMLLAAIFAGVMVLTVGENANAQTVKNIAVTIGPNDDAGDEIQDALDMALEDQSGETLYEITLPAGTYKLDALLKVFSYTTIKMYGCTLVRDADKSMLRIGYEESEYTGYEGMHDITIEGGCFDGDGKKGMVETSMVRMGHGYNITFRNVTFQNVYDTHHVELAACNNVLFEGCVFKDFYGDGDTVNSANNEALQFDIIHNETHFPKYPGFDDTPCANITVNNCTFQNLQRGLGTHSAVAGSYFTNMKFTNNVFRDISGYAMIATNFKSSEISGNTVERCGAGILFRSMIQAYSNFYTPLSKSFTIDNNADSIIENNKISVVDNKYKTTAYGISLYGEKLTSKKKDAPKGDYTLKGVKVQNNTITMNNSGYGIWLQGTNNCTISNNKVTMSVNASVSGGGNSDCIRLVKGKNNVIEKNTLTQKKKNKKTSEACGIVITTNSSATVTGNKITNSPKDGIFVITKSSAKITKNTIKKTGRHGVNVCVKSTVTMKGNKISGYKAKITNTYSGGKIKEK